MVLEWSKLLMYKSYAAFKDYFNDRLRIGYTDTDAFVFIIESDTLYSDRISNSVFLAE